jgi:hypothetical protein
LATAVDDQRHFLAVFRRLDGRTFSGGFDLADLRIARGFKFGYEFLVGQAMGRRQDANYHQTAKDCPVGWSHDLRSSVVERRKWMIVEAGDAVHDQLDF